MPFRILCADDSPLTISGIAALNWTLGNTIDRFVGSVAGIEEALQQEHFDVLITEVELEQRNVIEQIADIKSRIKELKVILYTRHINSTTVAQAVAHRFYDVVFKSGSADKLIRCVESLESGTPRENSPVERFRRFLTEHRGPIPAIMQVLTKREQHTAMLLAHGLNNKEISCILDISLETVKEHIQNALRKMKAKDRIALAVTVIKHRIPTIDLLPEDLA